MHPQIVRTPGTSGGRARLDVHRVRVMDIVLQYEQQGLSPDEIVLQLPSLRLAEVHAALAYFYDHREEVEADIREDAELAARYRPASPSLIDDSGSHRHRLLSAGLPQRQAVGHES